MTGGIGKNLAQASCLWGRRARLPSYCADNRLEACWPHRQDACATMTISDLPAINASLNFISTIFIAAGWYLIRRGYWRRHVACMIPALISSTLFLIGYLVYHAHVGERSTHFTAQGIIRPIYFAMLISHILLAFVTLPLVILTLVPVFRRRWERHTRIARWTMPIWLYVSVTAAPVCLMPPKWFPPVPPSSSFRSDLLLRVRFIPGLN